MIRNSTTEDTSIDRFFFFTGRLAGEHKRTSTGGAKADRWEAFSGGTTAQPLADF